MGGVRVTMFAMQGVVRHLGATWSYSIVLGVHATQVTNVLVSRGVKSYLFPPVKLLLYSTSFPVVTTGTRGVKHIFRLCRSCPGKRPPTILDNKVSRSKGKRYKPCSGPAGCSLLQHFWSPLWRACHGGATFPLLNGYPLARHV